MRTRVGVRPFDSFSSVDELKRDSLLFDQIAISELSMNLGYAEEYAETDEDRRRRFARSSSLTISDARGKHRTNARSRRRVVVPLPFLFRCER